MNNKCGCGCESGFVPVSGNWDFNMDGGRQPGSGCQSGSGCQRQRQNRCNACETADEVCRRDCQAEYTNNGCTGRADCSCEHCARRREAACGTCAKNACTRQADCPCEDCARRREAARNTCGKQKNKADNRGVSIMWAKAQEIDDVYDCGRALKAGTLYPELHKSLNGYWPCEAECGDKCQQIAFAMWELRLYLNTHPNDKEALMMLHKLQENCCEPNYATTFLEEVCCSDGTRNPAWRWTRDPWPWEYDANCGC